MCARIALAFGFSQFRPNRDPSRVAIELIYFCQLSVYYNIVFSFCGAVGAA